MTSRERWQVSGNAAEQYERFVASWFADWATDLVGRARVQRGWRVLDVACGTGVVTRALGPAIGPTGALVASDLNQGMLAEARRHDVSGAPVQWRLADATDLPFESGSFDAVLCQQGLQFVPDRAKAVAEMRRVLQPNAVAAVSVWRSPEHNPYIAAMAEGLTNHLSTEAGQTMLAPCALGDADELADLFDRAGFTSVDIQAVSINREPADPVIAIGGNLAALPIADAVAAMEPAAYAAMVDGIATALADHMSDGKLIVANSAHVAVGMA